MKTRKFSAFFLALASTACSPTHSVAADAPSREVAKESSPQLPQPPLPPQTQPMQKVANEQAERALKQVKAARAAAGEGSYWGPKSASATSIDSDLVVGNEPFAGALGRVAAGVRSVGPDAPVLLITEPTDEAAAAEWAEDLKVMEKLLRDEVARAGGGADDAMVMGIQLTMLGRSAPMYLDGCGAIFRIGVNWPLATSEKSTEKKPEKPQDPTSRWERAKRDMAGSGSGSGGGGFGYHPLTSPKAPPAFSQEKVDALIAGIIRVLPEASNVRRLKENEFVFVSVSGSDDRGAPVRLTIKVRKSDIDEAANGKLKPEDFKLKVARRIG